MEVETVDLSCCQTAGVVSLLRFAISSRKSPFNIAGYLWTSGGRVGGRLATE